MVQGRLGPQHHPGPHRLLTTGSVRRTAGAAVRGRQSVPGRRSDSCDAASASSTSSGIRPGRVGELELVLGRDAVHPRLIREQVDDGGHDPLGVAVQVVVEQVDRIADPELDVEAGAGIGHVRSLRAARPDRSVPHRPIGITGAPVACGQPGGAPAALELGIEERRPLGMVPWGIIATISPHGERLLGGLERVVGSGAPIDPDTADGLGDLADDRNVEDLLLAEEADRSTVLGRAGTRWRAGRSRTDGWRR